jgi:hypothetical protein
MQLAVAPPAKVKELPAGEEETSSDTPTKQENDKD